MSWKLKIDIKLWGALIFLGVTFSMQPCFASGLLQQQMEDGVVLRVYPAKEGEEKYSYAQKVLAAACRAYQEIVFEQGFNRPGYTFAHPTRLFGYDRDRTIDIYIKNVEAPFVLMSPGDDAGDNLEYQAKIFIPANYVEYQKKYKIKQPQLELKASLTHELLHIILYSYNHNMQVISSGKVSLISQCWDWYTEGLARYFETLVGYREEFLSAGFRQRKGRVIQVYKGGVNYFLKYPDRPLSERKYDFALFWQYVHKNFGMRKIEEISAKFREAHPASCSSKEAMEIIAQTLDIPLKNLIRNFSLYVYKCSSLPNREDLRLEPVSISKLSVNKNKTFSSISSFGFDFYEIDLEQDLQNIQLKIIGGGRELNCLVGIHSPFGFSSLPYEFDASGKIRIDAPETYENSKMIIIFSNPTEQKIYYRIMLD